jgi:uncharacterized membrane protein YccC
MESTASQFVSKSSKELLQVLKSVDFSTAVIIGISVTIPTVLGILTGHLEVGLALSFGAFWSSPSNVSGSFHHKMIGILLSAVLIMCVSFMGGYLHYETWTPLPILGVLTFAIAFISVYGFRASLISFSGLLALVLSFANSSQELEVYQYALLTGAGSIWYLLLTLLWNWINPTADTEEVLSDIFLLTSEFLKIRGKLVGPQSNRKELQSKLLTLQSELIEHHAVLREILIVYRKNSGRSNYNGKRLLVFTQLVEMLETAIANPVNYDKMDALFLQHPEYVKSFQGLILEMSNQLLLIAEAGKNVRKLPPNNTLKECFERVKQEIKAFNAKNGDNNHESFFMLQNFFEYQEKQFNKLKKIKWLLGNPDLGKDEFIDKDVARRFIVHQDYDPKLLLRNLSLRSTIFKHSLRLAVTIMAGYALGTLFKFQNPYWILLTIIVIMRPSYGLTKTLSKDRIIGTLIGGAIASGMVFITSNQYVYGAIGIVSLIIAFTMVQRNHKASATFITLSVIFVYAIIRPDILTVIQYRILDTLLGAALSFVAMLWLWPAWGFREIRKNIENSVDANRDFLGHISNFYRKRGHVPTSYKVSRKEAFLETSNLSSAFQRMTQEPKSKRRDLDKIYEMVELNHTFLASLASISSYIQHYPTTEASEMFMAVSSRIDKNLLEVLRSLKGDISPKSFTTEDEVFFEEQLRLFQLHHEKLISSTTDNKQLERNYQEAHLVWEQLRWLLSLSGNMLRISSLLKLD